MGTRKKDDSPTKKKLKNSLKAILNAYDMFIF